MEAILIDTMPDAAMPPGPVFMEHRFGQRFRCGTGVRISAADGISGHGRLANVSLSGAFLETRVDLPLYATIEIARPGERGGAVRRLASVVRRDHGGFGVEWCETPTRSICQIFGCGKQCPAA
jgi:hypothetical protein